ncbi:hypothetical protein BGX31_005691 [Mortierella sp. GBA43]|nr:hypothetical protein BGX31_005691 [Mortierella sp. GBA43]
MSPRGTSPPKPVKETRTMTKEYDPTTGVKMINKYMVVQELGRGVHGKVKLCRDTTTGKLCAIKIVDKTTRKRLGRGQITNAQKIRREIAIMKKCIHPNVVRLIEVIDDPDVRKIYLVLEYMEGGEVRWKDSDGRPILSLEHARSFFRDIVLGLEYLHMQGIIHRDIKPANLLLSGDGTVKISDFGVSHFSEKNVEYHQENTSKSEKDSFFKRHHHQWNSDLELAKTAGSPAFFAPELCYASELSPAMSPMLPSESQSSLGGEPSTPTGMFSVGSSQGYSHRPPITKAIDVWALGVTLYCFIYGRCPFNAETEFELFNMIPRVQPSYESVPGREDVCPELKDLLSRLLEKDVSRRITLKEVKEHPWVVEDLKDPEKWRIETDPSNYQRVFVTDEEVKSAVTIMDKIKKHFRRLSVSITNLAFNRRRSKSFASAYPPGPRSPTSTIMGLPVPTTSQSMDHAMAQPQRFTSPMSLPERFQKFQMFGQPHSGSNSNSVSTATAAVSRNCEKRKTKAGSSHEDAFQDPMDF